MKIPFNQAHFSPKILEKVETAFRDHHISGAGSMTTACEEQLKALTGCGRALLTTSCTHALEMSALLLDLKEGDEVIMPSFTFVSTANAFALRGARPVFVDIRPDTLNLDETKIEEAITEKTRAIVVVHYAGVACEMDTILQIAKANQLAVIEDNAHGLFGKYQGKALGSFGCLATQSFHETKNVTCGEGGALLINDQTYLERAEMIREKGTNRAQFFRGKVEKYSWVDIGSSYVISEILAGVLLAGLEGAEESQASRKKVWDFYRAELSDWAETNAVRLPEIPEGIEHPSHLFYLLLPSNESRDQLIDHLAENEILAVFHYLPLHRSPMGKRIGADGVDCPVTDQVSDTILRLPLYNFMAEADTERVIETIRSFEIPPDQR